MKKTVIAYKKSYTIFFCLCFILPLSSFSLHFQIFKTFSVVFEDGATIFDLQLCRSRHHDSCWVHWIFWQLHHHCFSMPAEASFYKQQIHLQLWWPHFQLSCWKWIQYVMHLSISCISSSIIASLWFDLDLDDSSFSLYFVFFILVWITAHVW